MPDQKNLQTSTSTPRNTAGTPRNTARNIRNVRRFFRTLVAMKAGHLFFCSGLIALFLCACNRDLSVAREHLGNSFESYLSIINAHDWEKEMEFIPESCFRETSKEEVIARARQSDTIIVISA